MPRHYFDFPDVVKEEVRSYVERAVRGINPRRFAQEPQYTTALAGRLIGTAYSGPEGKVAFDATSFDDRGRASAESRFGADFAITAQIESAKLEVGKAIIFQSKRGPIQYLSRTDRGRLEEQIKKMQRITRAPKILEIDGVHQLGLPRVISAGGYLQGRHYQRPSLPDYIVSKVLTTIDGDTSAEFVNAVADSSLTVLRVIAFMT